MTKADWKQVEKALRLFEGNPRHPSLRDGPIEGHPTGRYIRASRTLRLAYRFNEDKTQATFFWVGRHDDFDKQF